MTATNAITIKDTPERIAAAGRIITAIDKARPEVIIDVELLEVNRTHLHEYGLQVASPSTAPTGINGTADVNREGFSLRDLHEPHAGRRAPHEPAGALLPAAQDRQRHARPGQSAAAHVRRHRRRRPGSASACRCR